MVDSKELKTHEETKQRECFNRFQRIKQTFLPLSGHITSNDEYAIYYVEELRRLVEKGEKAFNRDEIKLLDPRYVGTVTNFSLHHLYETKFAALRGVEMQIGKKIEKTFISSKTYEKLQSQKLATDHLSVKLESERQNVSLQYARLHDLSTNHHGLCSRCSTLSRLAKGGNLIRIIPQRRDRGVQVPILASREDYLTNEVWESLIQAAHDLVQFSDQMTNKLLTEHLKITPRNSKKEYNKDKRYQIVEELKSGASQSKIEKIVSQAKRRKSRKVVYRPVYFWTTVYDSCVILQLKDTPLYLKVKSQQGINNFTSFTERFLSAYLTVQDTNKWFKVYSGIRNSNWTQGDTLDSDIRKTITGYQMRLAVRLWDKEHQEDHSIHDSIQEGMEMFQKLVKEKKSLLKSLRQRLKMK